MILYFRVIWDDDNIMNERNICSHKYEQEIYIKMNISYNCFKRTLLSFVFWKILQRRYKLVSTIYVSFSK